MLLPYTYSCAHEAVTGKPLMRAMFLDDSNDYTYGSATRYQYMYGPSFLVAPVYQNTAADKEGNDVRNGIYLPKGNMVPTISQELPTKEVAILERLLRTDMEVACLSQVGCYHSDGQSE